MADDVIRISRPQVGRFLRLLERIRELAELAERS